MEFDILNQLLTSTVYSLFNQKIQESSIENKRRVKELEKLSKPETTSTKSASLNDSVISGSSTGNEKMSEPRKIPQCESIQKWMAVQSNRRLKQSIQKLGLDNEILRLKIQLQNHLDKMSLDDLVNQKKKVKNELKIYDNDFLVLFKRAPNRAQKQPFRVLYGYYKKLKEYIQKKGGQSQQEIQNRIKNIKNQRRLLRQKIEAYQNNFQQTNNRRIKYVRDIQPIEMEYRKYKELKTQLQRLEQILR